MLSDFPVITGSTKAAMHRAMHAPVPPAPHATRRIRNRPAKLIAIIPNLIRGFKNEITTIEIGITRDLFGLTVQCAYYLLFELLD
jgi:hypothetical protein